VVRALNWPASDLGANEPCPAVSGSRASRRLHPIGVLTLRNASGYHTWHLGVQMLATRPTCMCACFVGLRGFGHETSQS
jgi:hypothetical protein